VIIIFFGLIEVSVVRSARAAMGMNQETFGVWLADKIGRSDQIPPSRISEWESGKRSPRKNVRDACLPVVAGEIASDAVFQVSGVFRAAGVDVLSITMSPEMKAVKATIKKRIISETS